MSELNIPAGAAAAEPAAVAPDCACTLFAVVNVGGGLVRECGALAAQNPAAGVYNVQFNRPVELCAWVATIGLPDEDDAQPRGVISVAGRLQPDQVQVRTYDCNCVPANRPFHLAVHCCPEKDEG